MRAPAFRSSERGGNDEALEILRRIEPVLSRLVSEQAEMRKENAEARKEFGERFRKHSEDIARLEGRASQLPTLWQIAPMMLAIDAGVVAIAGLLVVLIRFASP